MELIEILIPEAVRNTQSVGSKKRLFQDLATIAEQNYGINPDIGIILWTYDVPEEDFDFAIDAVAPLAKYWHCKNLHTVHHPENNRSVFIRVPLPDGEIDYRYAISAMYASGYSGYMTIEGAWAGDQWVQDEKSIKYAKAIWDELEA